MSDTITVILSGLSSGFGIVIAQMVFRWVENQHIIKLMKKKTDSLLVTEDKSSEKRL